jgi:hypothetical protein
VQVSEIEFQFKGKRNYIHGTDIFNAMISSYPGSGMNNIRFTVHDFVRTPLCQLYLAEAKDELNAVEGICARSQFDADGITHWLALTQGKGDATTGGRYAYDEDRIISACRMNEQSIALVQQSQFNFIETIVSMNKHMHEQLFPDVTGKWIFTRIDLDTRYEDREKLALRFRHNMNYRLTKSDILANDKKIGDIYFSLVKS